MWFLFANNSNSLEDGHYLKTNIIPTSQEIPAFYGNRISTNSSSLVPIRIHMMSVHVISPYFFMIHFSIIFAST
jgi:hypothetical protein